MTRGAGALLAALALAAGGCGGSESADPSAAKGKLEVAPLGSGRVETPTAGQIERFGRIKFPPSARGVQARMSSALDAGLSVRFVMDRADVDGFVRRGHFTDLTHRYQPYGYPEFGWRLDRIRHLLGGESRSGSYMRELVIDLDRPGVATAYLVASTL